MTTIIEDETGTFTGGHPHDGYYAGDFSVQPVGGGLLGSVGQSWPR